MPDTLTTEAGSAELEREVDADRARVSDTIDALQTKASIGNIVDQFVQSMGEHGGEAGRNLGRTIRDNPLPLILTGVGLTWLVAGSGGSRRDPDGGYREYRPYDGGAVPGETASLRPASSGRAASPAPHTRYGSSSASYSGTGGTGGTSAGGTSSSSSGESYSDKLAGSAKDAQNKLSDTAQAARDTVSDTAQDVSAGLSDAADTVRATADDARASARDSGRRAMHQARRAEDWIADTMREQPLVFGAIAMAVGAAVGGALPRSRVEDNLIGERSDALKDSALSAANDGRERVEAAASAAVDEASRIANEKAGDIDASLPESEAAVKAVKEEMEDGAKRVADRAAEAAEKTGSDPAKT